jgi:phytoene synthase
MNANQYCLEKAAASGSSFYYSFRFLPPAKRQAITAFYAFCREVDDIVDECTDVALAQRKLDWWRQEVQDLYAGAPHHPVTQALAPAISAYRIPAESLQDIITGMEMDLGHVRYTDFTALTVYCHHVAGVVGEVSARIFGYSQPDTLRYAALLGLSFQLTNIIRDVGEDAKRNRIYLPLDELAQFNVSECDLLNAKTSENFKNLMEYQYQRAHATYQLALDALPLCDRKSQKTGLIMTEIYRSLLDKIRFDGYPVLTHRTRLTSLRKLWLAWRAWMLA